MTFVMFRPSISLVPNLRPAYPESRESSVRYERSFFSLVPGSGRVRALFEKIESNLSTGLAIRPPAISLNGASVREQPMVSYACPQVAWFPHIGNRRGSRALFAAICAIARRSFFEPSPIRDQSKRQKAGSERIHGVNHRCSSRSKDKSFAGQFRYEGSRCPTQRTSRAAASNFRRMAKSATSNSKPTTRAG